MCPSVSEGRPEGSTKAVGVTAVLCVAAAVVAAAAHAVVELELARAGESGAEMGPERAGPVVEVFRRSTGRGYGYRISTENGFVIHQPHLPAVPGHVGFATAHDARRVARLVVHRMEAGIFPPAISRRDLDSLGVRTSGAASTRAPPTTPLPSLDDAPHRREE